MNATIDMKVTPNSAAKFRALIAFEMYISDNFSQDALASHNIIINEIYYHKPYHGIPAMWQFSGTIETRIAVKASERGGDYQWIRQHDSAFSHLVTANDVKTAMARKFNTSK